MQYTDTTYIVNHHFQGSVTLQARRDEGDLPHSPLGLVNCFAHLRVFSIGLFSELHNHQGIIQRFKDISII